MCVCVVVYASEDWYTRRPKASDPPGAGLTGGYEMPAVGAGIHIWVLWKND